MDKNTGEPVISGGEPLSGMSYQRAKRTRKAMMTAFGHARELVSSALVRENDVAKEVMG